MGTIPKRKQKIPHYGNNSKIGQFLVEQELLTFPEHLSSPPVASTMFNDGVINMGRVLVLFAFTSQMGQQYPTDAWKFWDIYHAVLKGTEYEYFNRSLIHQSE
jgi:hypothetical protein